MKVLPRKCGAPAMTLIELICAIAITAILAALVLPAVVKHAHQPSVPVHQSATPDRPGFSNVCARPWRTVSHVRAQDSGGSMEFVQNAYRVNGDFYFGFRHFQALPMSWLHPGHSSALSTSAPAQSFADLKNEHVSYFVGVRASPDQPMVVLAGDETSGRSRPTLILPLAVEPGITSAGLRNSTSLRGTSSSPTGMWRSATRSVSSWPRDRTQPVEPILCCPQSRARTAPPKVRARTAGNHTPGQPVAEITGKPDHPLSATNAIALIQWAMTFA